MEIKELKAKFNDLTYLEWYKTVQIEFHSNPSDIHKTFKGFESFYKFILKEKKEWSNDTGISEISILNTSKIAIVNLVDEVDQSIGQLTSYRNQPENLRHRIQSAIEDNRHKYYIYNSPQVSFLKVLHKTNQYAIPGAHLFFSGMFRNNYSRQDWVENREDIIGVIAAYEFTTSEMSQIFNRRIHERKAFAQLRNEFDEEIKEIAKIKEDNSTLLNEKIEIFEQLISELRMKQNENYDTFFKNYKKEFDTVFGDSKSKMENLQKLYNDKLVLEKPAEFWGKRAEELKKSATLWLILSILSSVIGLIVLGCLIFSLSTEQISKHIQNPSISIRWSILSLLSIAIIVFLVRTFTKLTMSSYHLYRDAQERKQLTYLYLTLKNEAEIPDADRHIILQSLFSRSDTGLLKEDSGPTMPVSMLDKFNSKA